MYNKQIILFSFFANLSVLLILPYFFIKNKCCYLYYISLNYTRYKELFQTQINNILMSKHDSKTMDMVKETSSVHIINIYVFMSHVMIDNL